MEVGKFVGGVVGVVISVLMITALGLPVINTAVAGLDAETDADIIQMLEVIPILLVVAVIVGIVALFISRRD